MHSDKKTKSYEIDMCNGPLFGKLLLFAVPLMCSGILQLLFNAADMVVVGRFAGSDALAAVGATGSLINLLINMFMGLSVGTNVLVAHYLGAKQDKEVSLTVHTSIALSLIGSIILGIGGFLLSKPLLSLMGTPDNVIDQSALYMQIYFVGIPAMLLYNFGGAIMRAMGDTKRPLYFLSIAGVINVLLNLFFVIVLRMGVAGVALATVISQVVSAFLILRCLIKSDTCCRFILSQLRIDKDKAIRIMKIGLPAGFQGSMFSISNVLIQSSINSFGSIAMAGNTAAVNLEGFVYNAMNSLHQTALSFTSQNMGARKFDRIKKTLTLSMLMVFLIGASLGFLGLLFGKQLLSVYSSDPEVIAYGFLRLEIILSLYFLCGMMDVIVGSLRGLGASILPMLVSLFGVCGFRILWIYTIFEWNRSLPVLYWSYPITWSVTLAIHLLCFFFIFRKLKKRV